MRIIGHMVTHNEYGRYLTQSLPWLQQLCDDVVVFDDQSSDETFEYARSLGVLLSRRSDLSPSFAQNESSLRQEAWWVMEGLAQPEKDDWILCLDADEFLISDDGLRPQLVETQARSLSMPVDEIFGFGPTGDLLVRRDGYWGNITASRLARWEDGGIFISRLEGGGSIPSLWAARAEPTDNIRILHLGYADPADRVNKFERYSKTKGHNQTHIASINGPAHLQPWTGTVPDSLVRTA